MSAEPCPDHLALSAKLLRPMRVTERGPDWHAAEAEGWDMSLIERNLLLTPEERLREHDFALQQATAMREGLERMYAGTRAAD